MNPFEVWRTAGGYDLAAAREHFRKFGIIVLKRLLPSDTQQSLRAALEGELVGAAARDGVLKVGKFPRADFLLGDVLAFRSLESYDYIFFRQEVLDVARGLLNTPELVYWGDSNVQFGEAARGFHKDNVDRSDGTKGDWVGPYDLIRCGFYLQDHSTHSGGLKIRLGSHDIPNHLEGRMRDVQSEYGDLVMWNMRLTHSGNSKKLKVLPRVALHPRLEEVVPPWLCHSEEFRRIGAFWSIGKPGAQLDRYIARMNEREDYKPYFRFARNSREAAALVSRYGLSFRLPNDLYGELDRSYEARPGAPA